MLPIFHYPAQKEKLLKRVSEKKTDLVKVRKTCFKIIEDVKKKGDLAVTLYNKKFGGNSKNAILIPQETFRKNRFDKKIDKKFRQAIKVAIENITAFHKKQKSENIIYRGKEKETLILKTSPIEKAGFYIPGGTDGDTPLFSSLLMNAIPAKIAGVEEISCATPTKKDGTLNIHLAYVLSVLGIKKVYGMGGAQAIAALAYGTKTVEKVDIISGPGNIFVNEAKKIVFGDVMIDGLYGHSEIVIISDGSHNPKHIAADMLSQSEHAGGELALLISTKKDHLEEVLKELKSQTRQLKRKKEIEKSLSSRGCAALVKNLADGCELANAIAPEHLEILTKKPEHWLKKIRHAGAIFVGTHASEPIGDYICGTNHVLPTNGSARFSSPLGVYSFQKRSNVILYNQKAFKRYAPHAMTMAEFEKLDAHKAALEKRLSP